MESVPELNSPPLQNARLAPSPVLGARKRSRHDATVDLETPISRLRMRDLTSAHCNLRENDNCSSFALPCSPCRGGKGERGARRGAEACARRELIAGGERTLTNAWDVIPRTR